MPKYHINIHEVDSIQLVIFLDEFLPPFLQKRVLTINSHSTQKNSIITQIYKINNDEIYGQIALTWLLAVIQLLSTR